MGWQRPPGSGRLGWRCAAALTKDKIGFLAQVLAQGCHTSVHFGRGWRGGSDEAMFVRSGRRPPPRDLVMLQWKNEVVVQEVPRVARWSRGETFGRWDVTV